MTGTGESKQATGQIRGCLFWFRQRGIRFALPNGREASIIWDAFSYSVHRDVDLDQDPIIWRKPGFPAREMTLDELCEYVRTVCLDSVEIAGQVHDGHGARAFLRPPGWDDDVKGYATADDLRALVLWLTSQTEQP